MKYLLFWLSCVMLASCASTDLKPVTTSSYVQEDDERRIWKQVDEVLKKLNKSPLVYNNQGLENYLDEVSRKIMPPSAYNQIPFKVRVIKHNSLNAFALPNGAVYLHMGILANMENEAQLATLLAHEMTHATHRHTVRKTRDMKNKTAALSTLLVVAGSFGSVGDLAAVLSTLAATSSIFGYSRDMETEADMEGIVLVGEAGYDIRESPKFFTIMKKDIEEEGEKKEKHPFFFSTHPAVQDRIENYESFIKTNGNRYPEGVTNADRFLAAIGSVILENTFLDVKTGRFKRARRNAEKYLSLHPEDPKGHYLKGEIERQDNKDATDLRALAHYQKAIELDSTYADPYRSMGLLYLKSGNNMSAKDAFQHYLELDPDCKDKAFIEQYLKQCEQGGSL